MKKLSDLVTSNVLGKNKEGCTIKSVICSVLVGVCFLLSVAEVHAEDCRPNENFGKVKRIYPHQSIPNPGTFFHLHDGVTNAVVGDAYYFISAFPDTSSSKQSVHRSTQDLLLEAAKSGWTVYVRTFNCGAPAVSPAFAPVSYLYVDFP